MTNNEKKEKEMTNEMSPVENNNGVETLPNSQEKNEVIDLKKEIQETKNQVGEALVKEKQENLDKAGEVCKDEKQETEEEIIKKKKKHRIRKIIYIVVGCIGVGLGAVGAVVPLLPSFPFLCIAAFCFARSSDKLNNWLKSTKLYKKNFESFAKGEGMTWKTKIKVLTTITILMAIGFIMMKNVPIGRIVLGCVWALHIVIFVFFIKTKKEKKKTEDEQADGKVEEKAGELSEDKGISIENSTNEELKGECVATDIEKETEILSETESNQEKELNSDKIGENIKEKIEEKIITKFGVDRKA